MGSPTSSGSTTRVTRTGGRGLGFRVTRVSGIFTIWSIHPSVSVTSRRNDTASPMSRPDNSFVSFTSNGIVICSM